MTVSEIFGRINAHQIEGVMLHSQLAEYFGFLKAHKLRMLGL